MFDYIVYQPVWGDKCISQQQKCPAQYIPFRPIRYDIGIRLKNLGYNTVPMTRIQAHQKQSSTKIISIPDGIGFKGHLNILYLF